MDPLDYSFTVTAVNDTIDRTKGTRLLTLLVTHPGIIWTGTSCTQHHILKHNTEY